jgi:nitroreductase
MDLIAQRKSVRAYQDRTIERELIRSCVEAARLAPSAENVQPWRFIVIDREPFKRRFCEEVCRGVYRPTRFIENAPVVVAILAKLDLIANRIGRAVQGTQYYLLDIGIAGEHLVLRAQEMGIGTCWIGWFDARRAKRMLQPPPSWRVVSLIAMGYPAENATKDKPDRPMEDILTFTEGA